jgi:hypothetical protein
MNSRNVRSVVAIVCLALLLRSALCFGQPSDAEGSPVTLWATGDSLMPAWGFYPLGQSYGDTRPLGEFAAWCPVGNEGVLTWIADFPRDGEYDVWIRKYGGYGNVSVLLDEKPVAGGRGGPGGGRYVWVHAGRVEVNRGWHHIDLEVSKGMFDAVLLTTDRKLDPAADALPKPVEKPMLRALRSYRNDTHLNVAAREHGFVAGQATPFAEVQHDWLPPADDLDQPTLVRLWGAANQYVNGTFVVRAVKDLPELTVSLDRVQGPDGTTITAAEIDVRVVHVRERKNTLFRAGRSRVLVSELLLRDDRSDLPPKGQQGGFGGTQCVTSVPAHESRQFWLTVHIPKGSLPGTYRGNVTISSGDSSQNIRVEVEVLPISLKPADGYYAIYHRSQAVDPERPHYVSRERYLAELQDQKRHGLNAVTLYGGFSTLDLARQAGLMKAPCLMHWPGSGAASKVAEAKRLGFDDLYFYGVDEPNKPDQIERCRKEAERRQKAGLHMFTAINGAVAQRATRDFIDRPVYNIYVFGGRNNAEAMYVREKGFRPVSYWVSATAYPLPYRALTGLYNRACGYLGSSPWSYQDYPDDRLYDPDNPAHKVTYPDEFGNPIPTLAWEAHRAGIDDVRYLEALDRSIPAARKRLEQPNPPEELQSALNTALQVRRETFENISGRWFEYLCRIRPGDLEQARRRMADATVQLDGQLANSRQQHGPGTANDN